MKMPFISSHKPGVPGICLLLLFSLTFSHLKAGDNYRIEYLGIEQGLSNNAVTCIFQDHHGFMWFGTYDGLNRYDGYSFKIFRNLIGDSTSLRDNHIYTIEEDADYHLWIGSVKGISIYDPAISKFSTPTIRWWNKHDYETLGEGTNVIRTIDKGAYVLAGTQGRGLLLFEKKTLRGIQIPLPELKDKAGSYEVSSIEVDPSGQQAWIFIRRAGLYVFDIKTKSLKLVDRSISLGDCLRFDRKQNLWLANWNGLYKYDRNARVFTSNPIPFKYRIANLYVDKQDVLWIASDGGGVWYLPAGSSTPMPYLAKDKTPLVNSNSVYTVYEDSDGRRWVGTLRGGVNVIHPRINSFNHIALNAPGQYNLVNNFILSFCEDQKNNVWIGTDGAGLRYWDRKQNSFTTYVHDPVDKNSISSNFITGILKDSRNDTWISTWFGGINRLKGSSRAFEHFKCFNSQSNQEENNAWLVYEDGMQRIWASTTNNGTLYLFNRDKNAFELFDESIINVQCLAEDSNGILWGGNYTTLIRIDPLNKKHQFTPVGYPVRFIHEDHNKNFWIATEGGGLLLFDRLKGTYTRFSTANGLPNNTILRILEDKSGNLWLSTYNGLCKFNTKNFTCRNFSQSDGLQSNQFSFNAGLALHSNEFLFGGIRGFNVFYPDSIYDRRESPRIFLTNLKIDNIPVEENARFVTHRSFQLPDRIKVPFNKAILSMDFVALEYTGADKIRYAYLLEGWDKNWNYVNGIRTANYSRLQEGNYTFKVKATNADGSWSDEIILLKIRILPPWYRAWWAYCLYVLLLAAAVYIYILYNKRQERLRYEVKLANIEKEKEKELTEKKIAFFTHISHEFRTPLTLIINPIKDLLDGVKEENGKASSMSMIYRNAKRLLSLVDQLLLFRKVESVDEQLHILKFDIAKVCKEVCLCFSQHAVSRKIDLELSGDDKELVIYGDREKIEIILFNLISNAFKYTDVGGRVELLIQEQENKVEIIVKDTGCGIPQDAGNKLFSSFYQADNKGKEAKTGFGVGLHVSRKLAIAHQGELFYKSEPGMGTEFHLLLLKGAAHFGEQNIKEDYETGQTILHELIDEAGPGNYSESESEQKLNKSAIIDKLRSELPTMVIVDDNAEMRSYIKQIFIDSFNVSEAEDGLDGLELIMKETPDIVISDIRMKMVSGIELCENIKSSPQTAHVPVILLTGSSAEDVKLKGIECGAEDYLTKPFNKDIIVAKVKNIIKGRSRLQDYFFNAVTLKPNVSTPGENKDFIDRCITIVERHLDNPDFSIQTFCKEIGMSHPSLYKRVKSVSGLTVNVFIRYLRLRKAAELLISTDKTIVEIAYITGFNDIRYFREQFFKLFEMNPSEYIKRYRKVLGSKPVEE